MTLDKLELYLKNIYCVDTCYTKCRDNWNENNPTLGHCAIVSLIINDYLGGKIYKIKVHDISHYFNYIDNKIIDLTSKQFKHQIDYTDKVEKTRTEILSDNDTKFRYNLLKRKLELLLIDDDIHKCNLCSDMIEKFPNSKIVSIGNSNDIVILGEE